MSFEDSHQTKERIRQATDIVELIGASIQLRRAGRDHVGLCPFHDDTSPSLRVNPGRQSWKCWVCNIGGDVFSFVMQNERVDFGEAIKLLADKAGIQLGDYAPMRKAEPGSPDDKATLYKAVEWAEQQFHQQLLNSDEATGARDYLLQRGIEPHCIEEFRVGFAPDSWSWLLDASKNTPYSAAVLEAVDLATKRDNSPGHFDRFRGRIMFPIRDTQNRAIGFGGRVMPGSDEKAKYINSRETRLFSKSDTLYGLNVARDAVRTANEIVVMEGFTDVIMAHQFGFKRAVAALGTALNERHIKVLRRFADRVTLVLDGDTAGQKRANEILGLFVAADVDLKLLTLPKDMDPCDFFLANGKEAFEGLLGEAVDALEHRIRQTTANVNLVTDTHAATKALEQILETMASAPAGSLREEQLLARLGREFRIPNEQLRTKLTQIRNEKKEDRRPTRTSQDDKPAPVKEQRIPRVTELLPLDRELMEIMLVHAELVPSALEGVGPQDLQPGVLRKIFETIQGMELEGMSMTYNDIMTVVDHVGIKSLLVDLEERGRAKEDDAQDEAMVRLSGLLATYEDRRQEPERQQILAALEKQSLNNEEEVDLLNQLIEQQRNRQGL